MAAKKKVVEFVEPYKYNLCRVFKHAWVPVEFDTTTDIGKMVLLQCIRCTSTRKDVFNRRGGLNYRAYKKPDDYAVEGKFSLDEWRMDLIEEMSKPKKVRKKAS